MLATDGKEEQIKIEGDLEEKASDSGEDIEAKVESEEG